MMTTRDKKVCSFIEEYGGLTTLQATQIFFGGVSVSAYRRLKQLEDRKILCSYKVEGIKVYKYPEQRNMSYHDLLVLDFYAWIYSVGGEVQEFKLTPRYLNGTLIPDALVKCTVPYGEHTYQLYILLEVDYYHYTPESKMATKYERLCREGVLAEYCGAAEFPLLVVARETTGIRYNSSNFDVVYTDLKYSTVLNLVFS